MKPQRSTNFWIVFGLWVFATLFMSFVELIALFENKSEQPNFLVYTFLISSCSGTLLVVFNSLYLYKNKPYFKKMALLFLVGYLFAQITMIGYCFYKEIPNLGNVATIRIIFILFQLYVSFSVLRRKKVETENIE